MMWIILKGDGKYYPTPTNVGRPISVARPPTRVCVTVSNFKLDKELGSQ